MKLSQLDTPVLLIEEDPFLRNMKRMQELTNNAGITYRPHAKAHQSAEIAKMQKGAGAVGVCCAKLGEAEVLVSHDIKDILITTPVIGISKLQGSYDFRCGRQSGQSLRNGRRGADLWYSS